MVTSLVVVALLSAAITFQKRQIFRSNGGDMLKNVDTGLTFFTEGEVKNMTLNYGIPIGKGSFGEVFRGTLEDNRDGTRNSIISWATNTKFYNIFSDLKSRIVKFNTVAPSEGKHRTIVAVKKSSTQVDKSEVDEFVKEVEIQARIIHKNVLRLRGCCLEVKFPLMVYEFAANGSLREIIHGEKIGQKLTFPLELRLDIAIGSAEGLAYMHMQTTNIIQHGDVKPDNILLDDQSVPKLADFGLSKVLAKSKEYVDSVAGSMDYMDPAYLTKGSLTSANDVYSFGVVLLELITRQPIGHVPKGQECELVTKFRRAYEQEMTRRFLEKTEKARREMLDKDIASDENIPLLEVIDRLDETLVKHIALEENISVLEGIDGLTEMFDKEIASEENIPILEGIGRLAIECLLLEEESRPDMKKVARQLAILKEELELVKRNSQSAHRPEETTANDAPNSSIGTPKGFSIGTPMSRLLYRCPHYVSTSH